MLKKKQNYQLASTDALYKKTIVAYQPHLDENDKRVLCNVFAKLNNYSKKKKTPFYTNDKKPAKKKSSTRFKKTKTARVIRQK